MVKLNREQELLCRLKENRKLMLTETMEMLDISESTARRMFSKLEQDGVAIRTHGGVQLVNPDMTLYSFKQGARTNTEQKKAIADEACKLLEDGDVVFCDSGTTMQHFCTSMVARIQREQLDVKVYTNSLANLDRLSQYLKVTLVGGEYRVNRRDFCGYLAEQALQDMHFTKCFLGADGFAGGDRFTTTDFDTARMNEIVIANTQRCCMLVDSSKFSNITHVAYVDLSQLDTIITDTGIAQDTLSSLRAHKVKVICAQFQQQ